MKTFFIFTSCLLLLLLVTLFVMNKVWRRYTLEELLCKNDPELYKKLVEVADKHNLTVAGLTLVHYSLVKDDILKVSSPERACEVYVDFFNSYYKDFKKGVLETGIRQSADFGKVVEILDKENILPSEAKEEDFDGFFSEADFN